MLNWYAVNFELFVYYDCGKREIFRARKKPIDPFNLNSLTDFKITGISIIVSALKIWP
jgi:hypothetical protein